MKWIGYTTQHLNGNICILMLILIFYLFNKNKNNSLLMKIILGLVITIFSITLLYGLYLNDR